MSATLAEFLQRRIGARAELILLLTWITYANILYLCKVFYTFSEFNFVDATFYLRVFFCGSVSKKPH